jgi:hypothetical protein
MAEISAGGAASSIRGKLLTSASNFSKLKDIQEGGFCFFNLG